MKWYIAFLIALVLIIGGVVVYGPDKGPEENGEGTATSEGRVVFAITDHAGEAHGVTSILFTVSEIRVHSTTRGWITVFENIKQVDLLRLKENNTLAFLAEGNLEAGNYDQVRLTAKRVQVLKGEESADAKLPSSDLKIQGGFTVEEGKTSAIVFDVLADESLHVTGNGRYIFAPVIKLQVTKNTEATIAANNELKIMGGEIETALTAGMDENGEMKKDFKIDAGENTSLEIVGDAIRIVTAAEKSQEVKITAEKAIDAALRNKSIDTSLSVKLVDRDGKKVWRVGGLINFEVVSVYVDATTGGVIAVE